MRLSPRSKAILIGAVIPLLASTFVVRRERSLPVKRPAIPATEAAAPAETRTSRKLAAKSFIASILPEGGHTPIEQIDAMRRVLAIPQNLIPDACDELLKFSDGHPSVGGAGAPLLHALIVRWTQLAPEKAFAWAVSNPSFVMDGILKDCGVTWAAADAKGLRAWWARNKATLPGVAGNYAGSTVHAGSTRPTFVEHIDLSMIEWLTRPAPMEAIRHFAATLNVINPDYRSKLNQFGNSDAGQLVASDAEAREAVELLTGCLQTNATSGTYAGEIMEKWVTLNDRSMEAWLQTNPQNPLATRASEILGKHRMSIAADPAAAADAWLANPHGLSPQRVQEVIVDTWSTRELAAAGAWLNHRPRTPERWDAVEQFSRRAVTADPGAAFGWLATIEDITERHRRTARIFDQWERTDPANAAAFAQTSDWDPAQWQWIEELRAAR